MSAEERIATLQRVIRKLHRCEATHLQTTYLVEEFSGRLLWEGFVESFELHGHPEAKRCHAWIAETNGRPHPTVVLELPPVIGPHSAVSSAF